MGKFSLLTFFLLCGGYLVTCTAEPLWDDFKGVTWNDDLEANRDAFYELPKTQAELEASPLDYVKLNDHSKDGKFLGTRYALLRDDPALILLFDANGYIAGFQNAISKMEADAVRTKHFKYYLSKYYVLDKVGNEDMYFATVYFVNPIIICRGRTREEFEQQGTGTGFYIQVGDNPFTYIEMPMDQRDMLCTRWNKGGCAPMQGLHYFYELYDGFDCVNWAPYAAMYFKGQLVGIHTLNIGRFKSKFYGYASYQMMDEMMPRPSLQCIRDDFVLGDGISFFYLAFTKNPQDITCSHSMHSMG